MHLIHETRPILDTEHRETLDNDKTADMKSPLAREGPRSLLYHLKTMFLFTKSDFKTVIIPQSVFALSAAYSSATTSLTSSYSTENHDNLHTTIPLHRIALMLLWLYTLLLVEDIANQRLTQAIVEDAVNKPWRPLPAGRITTAQSEALLRLAVPLSLVLSAVVGALQPAAPLVSLIWLYNDLEGSSAGPIQRNVINALALACFGWGALTVLVPDAMTSAEGSGGILALLARTAWRIIGGDGGDGVGGGVGTEVLQSWTLLIALVVATTVHAQDFPDIEGDRERGRQSMPLRYGHSVSRWSLAVLCVMWSMICLRFWHVSLGVWWVPTMGVSCPMAALTLTRGGLDVDEVVWKLWCLWMVVLFTLPLCGSDLVQI